jgi:hypothetical protein
VLNLLVRANHRSLKVLDPIPHSVAQSAGGLQAVVPRLKLGNTNTPQAEHAVTTRVPATVPRADSWLAVKILAHRSIRELRRVIGRAIRLLPGAWTILRLPNQRLRSLKTWIENRRKELDWWDLPLGPYYETLLPSKRVMRIRPHCITANKIHPLLNVELDRVHNEAYLARIPNARILGQTGVVITPDGRVVEESTWGEKWLKYDRALTAWRLPRCQAKSGAFYTICSDSYTGYYHWLSEVLPRLIALDGLTIDTKVIVQSNLAAWQTESLAMLGIESDQLLSLDREYLQLDILYFPSYVGEPGNPHAKAIHWLREKLLPEPRSRQTTRRLYITRRLAARRRVANEAEIEPILRDNGFEVVEAETLSFREQINLFSEAEAVVGLHGAGLTNTIFADSGCKILEIFDPNHVYVHYYALADIMGHNYWYLLGEPSGQARSSHNASGHQDVHVPVDEFAKSLSAMLGNDSAVLSNSAQG